MKTLEEYGWTVKSNVLNRRRAQNGDLNRTMKSVFIQSVAHVINPPMK